ncbi:MAG: 50S ribosomal protein L13 [Microgenomates group bacterium]
MRTKSTKKSEIKRTWHLVDAKDKILGRLATQVANLLMGKNKPYFVPHLDCGDYVVVINASQVKVSGKKAKEKKYYRHSGYPGGFKEITFSQQMAKDPRKIIWHAVAGMLPKNKLRDKRLTRLKIFVDENHPYQDKLKMKNEK